MKKLLIITDLFPDKFNPFSEVFVQQQVNELAKSYEIKVIATRLKHKLSIEQDNQNAYTVTYIYIPYIKFIYPSLIFSYQIHAIPEITSVLKDWKPDLIHVHDFKHIPELLLLNYCLKKYNIPRYLTVHNIRTHPSMIKSKYLKWFYKLSFSSAYQGWTHIFTVNGRLKDIITRDAKVAKVSNIGNAITPIPEITIEQIEPYVKIQSDTSYKIISVGNLREEKGFSILLKSVSMLVKKKYDIQVVIVGKGVKRERLLSEINSLGLSGKVMLTGDLPNDIVRNLYSLFDAFVLASYSETFGIVYIEAMDAGLPVIGVKGQGIDGVVQSGINGLLVNPQDADDLAEKIEYLINNKDSAKEMAMKGQGLVKSEYQLTQLTNKIMRIYEQ